MTTLSYNPGFSAASSYSGPMNRAVLTGTASKNAYLGAKIDAMRGTLDKEIKNLTWPQGLTPTDDVRKDLINYIINYITIDHTNLKILCSTTYLAYKMLYENEDQQRQTLPYSGGNLLFVIQEELLIGIGKLKPEEAITKSVPQEIKNYATDRLFLLFIDSIDLSNKSREETDIRNKYFTLMIRYLKYIFSQLLTK